MIIQFVYEKNIDITIQPCACAACVSPFPLEFGFLIHHLLSWYRLDKVQCFACNDRFASYSLSTLKYVKKLVFLQHFEGVSIVWIKNKNKIPPYMHFDFYANRNSIF